MLQIRPSAERGHLDHGWLDTYHTFSFGDYQDPRQMGFRSLRVINEDRVAGGQGFGMHGHRDMEIVTLVLSGTLAHQDSLGNGAPIRPGELQRMSAGTGIRHSEFNPSESEPVHLYQIWLLPDRAGHEPSYEQRAFAPAEQQGRLRLVASPDGAEGSLTIHQDARIYLANVATGTTVTHELTPGRHAWLQVLRGDVRLTAGEASQPAQPANLSAGDGVAVSDETRLAIEGTADAELMLFDLA